jgi:hypothetical protein
MERKVKYNYEFKLRCVKDIIKKVIITIEKKTLYSLLKTAELSKNLITLLAL